MAMQDVFNITDANEMARQKRLKEARDQAWSEEGDFDWGKGILGGLKSIGGLIAAPATGGASLGVAAGGLGDIADAAGKKRAVNRMTGESIDMATPQAMGKAGQDLGTQISANGYDAEGNKKDSLLEMLFNATKGGKRPQGFQGNVTSVS